MPIIERIKLAIKWLIGNGVAKNQKEIGYLLGYKNESSFSQVINGKVPLPNDFIDRLSIYQQHSIKHGYLPEKEK